MGKKCDEKNRRKRIEREEERIFRQKEMGKKCDEIIEENGLISQAK